MWGPQLGTAGGPHANLAGCTRNPGWQWKHLPQVPNGLAVYLQKGWLERCQAWLQDRLTDTAGAVLLLDEESGISEVASLAEGVQALHHAK